MPTADPALSFWLRFAAREGALCEEGDDATFVVLPDPLREAFDLPEETLVTADPEVAREDGATLVVPGHPALNGAAERVLSVGDTGRLRLTWPARVPPSPEVLLARAREEFPVDHGRIDAIGPPYRILLPVLRIGALVHFTVSMDSSFQEQIECWVDGYSGLAVPDRERRVLATAEVSAADGSGGSAGAAGSAGPARVDASNGMDADGPSTEDEPPAARPVPVLPNLVRSVSEAYRLIVERAHTRSAALAAYAEGSRDAEIARARAYYAEALASIEKRRANAPADRVPMLDARAETTRAERVRRINEIEEKYRSHLDIRPIRLHLLEVPGLALPVDVLRGPRRYPIVLHWMLPAGAFAGVRCPSCGHSAPLVAGKDRLGCADCLAKRGA
jgi:hypothetical protein